MLASSTALVATLALLGSAAASWTPGSTTVRLEARDLGLKNGDGSVNIPGLLAETERLSRKFERNRANQAYYAQTMKDPTALWTGQVSVGTPAQTFSIFFDSGSSDFTLASSACTTSCGTKKRYNTAASSSSVKTTKQVRTSFVDGTSSVGVVYTDTVTAGGSTATGQDIVAATSLSSTVAGLASDGMGLSYPSLSSAGSSSLMFTLAAQGAYLKYPYFSILLSYTGRSELTFGGWNKARLSGRIRWYNVTPAPNGIRTYWQMGLSAPMIGDKVAAPLVTHILDSGTTLIIAPPSAAATFWSNVPGAESYSDEFWTYPCASPPDLSFGFSRALATKWAVSEASFNLGYLQEAPDRCVGAVIGSDLGLGTSWLLGDAFTVTNVYVMHDVVQNRIGIAATR
ncbi:hypothetical protein JCM9279_007205 [Rhodotorula babjevae]